MLAAWSSRKTSAGSVKVSDVSINVSSAWWYCAVPGLGGGGGLHKCSRQTWATKERGVLLVFEGFFGGPFYFRVHSSEFGSKWGGEKLEIEL